MPVNYYIFLSLALFSIGIVGVLTRRNAIIIFMCIELMLNAVNLLLVAFSQRHPVRRAAALAQRLCRADQLDDAGAGARACHAALRPLRRRHRKQPLRAGRAECAVERGDDHAVADAADGPVRVRRHLLGDFGQPLQRRVAARRMVRSSQGGQPCRAGGTALRRQAA